MAISVLAAVSVSQVTLTGSGPNRLQLASPVGAAPHLRPLNLLMI